jgi:amino acid permease
MSSAKMLILLCLIIFTLVLATYGGSTPAYRPGPGVKYWNEPGAFAAPYGTGKSPNPFLSIATY